MDAHCIYLSVFCDRDRKYTLVSLILLVYYCGTAWALLNALGSEYAAVVNMKFYKDFVTANTSKCLVSFTRHWQPLMAWLFVYGSKRGWENDVTLYWKVQWNLELQKYLDIDTNQFGSYENLVYLQRPRMKRPFYRALVASNQQLFNTVILLLGL